MEGNKRKLTTASGMLVDDDQNTMAAEGRDAMVKPARTLSG